MKRLLLPIFFLSAGFLSGQSQLATGTWSWSGSNESAGYLLTKQTGQRVRFQLEIQRGAPSYNSGFIEGEFVLKGHKGSYQNDEFGPCEISFDFRKGEVILSQPESKLDCGMGFGVYAQGSYKCRSHKTPKFSKGDPRDPEQ